MNVFYYFVTLSAYTTKMYEYYHQNIKPKVCPVITDSLNDAPSYLKLDLFYIIWESLDSMESLNQVTFAILSYFNPTCM